MKVIRAIALLVLKSAVRSKLFAATSLFLFACMAGLPFLIKGDGTAMGEARVLIFYNISIASTLIGMLALLQACGAVSQEIAEKQIQLIRAKPVSAMQIWLGKWLGIISINAALIVVAAVTTRGTLAVRGLSGGDVDREVLTSRRRIAPVIAPVDQEVAHRYHLMQEAGRFSKGVSEEEAKDFIKLMIVSERTTVGPGGEKRWKLTIPSGFRPNRGDEAVAEIRSRFNAAMRDEKPMQCSWRITTPEGEEIFRSPRQPYYDGLNNVEIPLKVLQQGTEIIVVFRNEETVRGRTVVFNESRGMEILASESSFAPNLVRGMLVVFAVSGLLAAIGLTLGSVFSFPVAVFCALSIVLASVTAHFFATSKIMAHSHSGCAHGQSTKLDVEWGEKMATVFERVLAPVFAHKPGEKLSEGVLISWRETGQALGLVMILYSGVLFVLGSLGLARRQLALPEAI